MKKYRLLGHIAFPPCACSWLAKARPALTSRVATCMQTARWSALVWNISAQMPLLAVFFKAFPQGNEKVVMPMAMKRL